MPTAAIAKTAIVHSNVEVGDDSVIEDYVVLGGPSAAALPLVIGEGATIRSHTVIYGGGRIGRGLQTGHAVMIREAADIGSDVSIGTHTDR